MTLKFIEDVFDYDVSFDVSNAEGDWTLQLTSQFTNLDIYNAIVPIILTNDRYTTFALSFAEPVFNEHLNGIYNYELTNGEENYVGLIKIISASGGTMNTTPYVSNNEDGEAPAYYRPNY